MTGTRIRSTNGRWRVRALPRGAVALLAVLLMLLVASASPASAAPGASTAPGASLAAAAPTAEGPEPLSARGTWVWPVDGRRVLLEPFRAPSHAYGPGHRGIDIGADAVGAVVRAPADGVVAFRGTVVDRPLVTIDHGDGLVTTLEPVESDLSPGDAVRAGEVVGSLAAGGHTPRGALHVGVRLHGVYINPLLLFGGVDRAVLLPCGGVC